MKTKKLNSQFYAVGMVRNDADRPEVTPFIVDTFDTLEEAVEHSSRVCDNPAFSYRVVKCEMVSVYDYKEMQKNHKDN